jgi:hypothetical protein
MIPFSNETHRRTRLARALRAYARDEREESHRSAVIELGSVAERTALLEDLLRRLENTARPVSNAGLEQVERLLAEPLPFRDYGPRAEQRNQRIAAILADLDRETG